MKAWSIWSCAWTLQIPFLLVLRKLLSTQELSGMLLDIIANSKQRQRAYWAFYAHSFPCYSTFNTISGVVSSQSMVDQFAITLSSCHLDLFHTWLYQNGYARLQTAKNWLQMTSAHLTISVKPRYRISWIELGVRLPAAHFSQFSLILLSWILYTFEHYRSVKIHVVFSHMWIFCGIVTMIPR